jgi:predicted glycoside hydrolase/deacetylase ChbG (UPF0249 family)
MCSEANESAKPYLSQNHIQSASIMIPCPWSDEFVNWYKNNPEEDVGVHLTLTSEWQTYRWGPVSEAQQVPGLLDPDGFLWRDVRSVVQHATPAEVDIEIHAQIDNVLANGIDPGHIDTHMGTLYASLEFAKVYLNAAMEYGIPAMALELTEPIAEHFRSQGYPITDELIKFSQNYTLPKLDAFYSVGGASTYQEKKQKFYSLVQSLTPGITEIIFHPSIESDTLKNITNSWQQRVWEAQMFSDPEVIQFFQDEGVEFTNWKEMMKRFRERT